ncbi:MAG: alpha/beta fold hydrolase, partial [Salinibacter sp.]
VGQILARKLFVKPNQKELRRKFVRRWARNDKQAYLWAMDAIMWWSVADRLDQVAVPTLLVSSDEDYTPVSAKERIAEQMPDAGVAVVKGARHALPVERPTAFNEVVGAFLEEVSLTSHPREAVRSPPG